tara:strand:+ start:553 stop:1332 length:780 start_codon:yes stop_codon:yes gene_type:complete
MDSVLGGIKEIQSILDDAKESIEGGLHLRLCNATLAAYEFAEAVKAAEDHSGGGDDDDGDGDEPSLDGEENQESDEEPERERTEDDMGLNELSELWEWQFDFGRPGAVRPLEDLIETILINDDEKRVCAAVRVLNRAVMISNPDDPADAERILQWKEELVEQRAIDACAIEPCAIEACAIEACAEILKGEREFECSDDDPCMYAALCDEILELFQRLGEGDALFRTKLRRNGALKAVEAYHATGGGHATKDVLDMLKRR